MALIGAGFLTACSDEPAANFNDDNGVEGVAYGSQSALEAGNPDSRTTVEETTAGHNLARAWDNTEKVIVFDKKDSKNIGVLTNNNGTFSGRLFYAGKKSPLGVSVAYLGKGKPSDEISRQTAHDYVIDITEQTGKLADLVKHDVQIASTVLNHDENGWNLNFTVNSVLSFIHYQITLPASVSATPGQEYDVTVSDLNTTATIDLASGQFLSTNNEAPIVTKATANAEGALDLYIAVIPGENQQARFAFNINGTDLQATDIQWTFEGNKYYRNDSGAGENIPATNPTETSIKYVLPWAGNNTKEWSKTYADGTITIGEFDGRSVFDGWVESFTFSGWKLGDSDEIIADNSATTLTPGNYTYTAQVSRTLIYDANEGTFDGNQPTYTQTWNYAFTAMRLMKTKPVREGYTFLGWSKSKTATTATYTISDEASQEYALAEFPNGSTIYAVWEKDESSLNVNAPNMPGSNPWGE